MQWTIRYHMRCPSLLPTHTLPTRSMESLHRTMQHPKKKFKNFGIYLQVAAVVILTFLRVLQHSRERFHTFGRYCITYWTMLQISAMLRCDEFRLYHSLPPPASSSPRSRVVVIWIIQNRPISNRIKLIHPRAAAMQHNERMVCRRQLA